MGRRKQHRPKRTNEDGGCSDESPGDDKPVDDVNDDEEQDNKGEESFISSSLSLAEISRIMQIHQQLSLKGQMDSANNNVSFIKDNLPLDLSIAPASQRQAIKLLQHSRSQSPANFLFPFANPQRSLDASSFLFRFPPPPPPPTPYFTPFGHQQQQPTTATAMAAMAAAAAAAASDGKPTGLGRRSGGHLGINTSTSGDSLTFNALQKMSELAKLQRDVIHNNNNAPQDPPYSFSNGLPSRWPLPPRTSSTSWFKPGGTNVSQGSKESPATEVFKCIWCQEKYANLAELTQHLKEAKHSSPVSGTSSKWKTASSSGSPGPDSPSSNKSIEKGSNSSKDSLLSTSSAPRKLVRGQDVWLGKGQEQTRQILKCMWCGESFKTLAELTVHMQETQHYTKVISQEQLSSWRNTSESPNRMRSSSPLTPINRVNSNKGTTPKDILKCQTCNESFSSLKLLSEHMINDNHLNDLSNLRKRPLQSMSNHQNSLSSAKEKRKKSLPVKKLLQMEREQNQKIEMQMLAKTQSCFSSKERDPFEVRKLTGCELMASDSESIIRVSDDGDEENSVNTTSILGSLERMVESSFTSRRTSSAVTSVTSSMNTEDVSSSKWCKSERERGLMATDLLRKRLADLIGGTGGSELQHNDDHEGAKNNEDPGGQDDQSDSLRDHADPLEALRDMCSQNSDQKPLGKIDRISLEDREVKEETRKRNATDKDDDNDQSMVEPESKFFKYSQLARQLSSR